MIRIPQLPGDAGIVQTVALMRAYVNNAITFPLIRAQAVKATALCGRWDLRCKALAIGEWVRNHVRYVPDPLQHEWLATPQIMAQAVEEGRTVYGDCDDMSMYVAALAKSIGLQPTFQVVGRKDKFHHVYVTINSVPVDPTEQMGTQPFLAQRRIPVRV